MFTILGVVGEVLGEMSPQYCIVKRIEINGHGMESFVSVPSLEEECCSYRSSNKRIKCFIPLQIFLLQELGVG